MRSCTGWPSRAWIDDPRRTAPDGSSFQLQHWTHSFDYALVAGDGDWREAAIPSRSAEFSEPLLVVRRSRRGRARCRHPARCSTSNRSTVSNWPRSSLPETRWCATAPSPWTPLMLALRLVESRGRTVDAEVRSGLGSVSDLRAADLLETPRPGQSARRDRQRAGL